MDPGWQPESWPQRGWARSRNPNSAPRFPLHGSPSASFPCSIVARPGGSRGSISPPLGCAIAVIPVALGCRYGPPVPTNWSFSITFSVRQAMQHARATSAPRQLVRPAVRSARKGANRALHA